MSDSAAKKVTIKQDGKAGAQVTGVPKGFTAMLEKLNDIPTLPIVATKVNELINNPNSSAADIAEVLKKDQILTAKVLKLINSPYYGIPGGVTDVKRALAFLGFNTLAQLILGMSVFSIFPNDKNDEFPLVSFWRHALGTAVCAEVIAKMVKYPKPEETFTCGLLHDIGKIVMYSIARDTLVKLVSKAKSESKSIADCEIELDIPSHAILGEYIAQKWGLPAIIRAAIRYHHQDVREMNTILESERQAVLITQLANAMTNSMKIGSSGNSSQAAVPGWLFEAVGLKPTDMAKIKDQTEQDMKKAGALLSVYN